MYGNIRRQNIPPSQYVSLDAVQEIVSGMMANPIKKIKPIEADGGAYRAYCYNILNKKK